MILHYILDNNKTLPKEQPQWELVQQKIITAATKAEAWNLK